MADIVKQILAKPIQLADQVIKAADDAALFRAECADLKSKTAKLADLLRHAARASSDLYDRPTRRIVDDTFLALDKALVLALKCRSANGIVKRAFTIIPAAAFRKCLSHLENSIGDLQWLLRVSNPKGVGGGGDDAGSDYLGLPPIAANEPILCLIWEQIAILSAGGSLEDRADAAGSLVSLARDNERYGKLIIEEGGVGPLLKLLKDGKPEGQESAVRALGLLGRDPECVEHMVLAGVCSVFAKILKEGPMKVQAMVAWAVSEHAWHHPKCQDLFAQHNIVRLLVGHLAFETVQEHSKYAIATQKAASMHHAVVMASNKSKSCPNKEADEQDHTQIAHPFGKRSQSPSKLHNLVTGAMKAQNNTNGNANLAPKNTYNQSTNHTHSHHRTHSLSGIKPRELEDPATKANMKAMSARALWFLSKENPTICRSITESRALLCFAVLLEKGTDEIKYNSAMALMEITAVAEKDPDLRRSAFKPNSPACKAVVDQLLRVIGQPDSNLLAPCVNTIGNLARTFRATETRVIGPLVKLLDEREGEVCRDAAVALTKFAGGENYLHVDHSKAVIEAGGVKHLVQLVYFGEQIVQIPALILLASIALHVPDSEELAQNEVLTVLEWATKQAHMMQDESRERLLLEAKSRVELFQSRGSR